MFLFSYIWIPELPLAVEKTAKSVDQLYHLFTDATLSLEILWVEWDLTMSISDRCLL